MAMGSNHQTDFGPLTKLGDLLGGLVASKWHLSRTLPLGHQRRPGHQVTDQVTPSKSPEEVPLRGVLGIEVSL